MKILPNHAVIVACHASFRSDVTVIPSSPFDDRYWVLAPFQKGEPQFYLKHIQRGIEIAKNDSRALLIFSGGLTHPDAGNWTEAATYFAIAKHLGWLSNDDSGTPEEYFEKRTVCEEYARDSFENLLFGICRFYQITGTYPWQITMVSWIFKEKRFDFHRETLRIPHNIFRYEGVENPVDVQSASQGEMKTLQSFKIHRYGNSGDLRKKRVERDPFHRDHPYRTCKGMKKFFAFLDNTEYTKSQYSGKLPWE